jgi:hypothetical protein
MRAYARVSSRIFEFLSYFSYNLEKKEEGFG